VLQWLLLLLNSNNKNKEYDQRNKKKTSNNNNARNDIVAAGASTSFGHVFGKKFVLLNPGVAERIARAIDLSSQESILEHFPPVDEHCGTKFLAVPLHILRLFA
jgi:hypothetical protein